MQNSLLWKEILPHIKLYDPPNKIRLIFSFISVTKDWENHMTEISFCTSLFPPFLVRNLGEETAHFSFPAFFQEQITTSTLSQQCWIAAHGQSQGSPFLTLILLCIKTKKKQYNEDWTCNSSFFVLPLVEKAKNFVEKK